MRAQDGCPIVRVIAASATTCAAIVAAPEGMFAMSSNRRLALVMLPLLALGACASQVPTRSAFLGDAPLSASAPDRLRWIAAGFDPAGYDGWMIESVEVRPADPSKGAISAEDAAELKQHLTDALTRAFGTTRPQRAAAGPRTLVVRAAVTGAERANPVVNGIATLAVLVPVTTGGAAAEMEVRDGATGQRLAALSAADNGSPLRDGIVASYQRYGHARSALDRQANDFAALVAPATTR
jgi:hypothetical protein